MTRKKPCPNKALQHAIIDSDKTQRQLAKAARLDETRFSQIVRGREHPPTETERAAIARVLGRQECDLFPASEALAS